MYLDLRIYIFFYFKTRQKSKVGSSSIVSSISELWITCKWLVICWLVLIDPSWFNIGLPKSDISCYLDWWRGWASETLTSSRISILVTACQSIIDFLLTSSSCWWLCLYNIHGAARTCILPNVACNIMVFTVCEPRQIPLLYIQGDI